VLVGSEDPATPPDQARLIADGIPGARVEVVPGAAHLLNVEQPEAFDGAALPHLTGEERP
jgi:pimeloyl-ACP methyl ester carboxylesterase